MTISMRQNPDLITKCESYGYLSTRHSTRALQDNACLTYIISVQEWECRNQRTSLTTCKGHSLQYRAFGYRFYRMESLWSKSKVLSAFGRWRGLLNHRAFTVRARRSSELGFVVSTSVTHQAIYEYHLQNITSRKIVITKSHESKIPNTTCYGKLTLTPHIPTLSTFPLLLKSNMVNATTPAPLSLSAAVPPT